jgi:hypothetical protein
MISLFFVREFYINKNYENLFIKLNVSYVHFF